MSYDKTKNLSLTSVILKGRNLSLVNLFCRHQWYLARMCYYNAPNRKFAEVFCYKNFNPKAQLILTWTGNQFYQKYFVVVSFASLLFRLHGIKIGRS